MLSIIKAPDPRLLTPCSKSFKLDIGTIKVMFDLMYQYEGIGLAANQVGLDAHLFITAWGEVFVGLEILEKIGEILVAEGCLSLPAGENYTQKRAEKIITNLGTFTGEKAIIIQHEIDHLEGREPWNERSI